MPSFTPPTVLLGSDDPFFGRYKIPVGQSVVRVNGVHQLLPYPWLGELIGAEGTDWFLGGRTYDITFAVADELIDAGFIVNDPANGFGEGEYGGPPAFGGSE